MIYGIRPEHISVGPGGIGMQVVVIEPTGSETQVFARSGRELSTRWSRSGCGRDRARTIGFVIDPADVHLFDQETSSGSD